MSCFGIRMTVFIAAAFAAIVLFTPFAAAQFNTPGDFNPRQTGQKSATDLTQVAMLADAASIKPGQKFHLAFVFDIAETWHLYWRNPGAGAAPPFVKIDAPSGFEVGEMQWPRPKVFESDIGDMYGYEKKLILYVPVKAPEMVPGGMVMFSADINWAVCDVNKCLIGKVTRTLSIQTGSSGALQPATQPDPVIKQHRKRLPQNVDDVPGASATFENGMLTVTGPALGKTTATLFPGGQSGVDFENPVFFVP